jgi:hypothetical protein
LAAAAMVRLLERTLQVIGAQPATQPPVESLRAVVRWALEQHLKGEMPLLPSTRSTLRDALMRHKPYMKRLMEVSEALGQWIDAAQKSGDLSPELPAEVVLYSLFARTCDPVLDYLKLSGNYDDAQIVQLMLAVAFDGLVPRRRTAQAKAARKAA